MHSINCSVDKHLDAFFKLSMINDVMVYQEELLVPGEKSSYVLFCCLVYAISDM